MYPLFPLMLPGWRSMHYILNCSSYLKYRLCVTLRFNLSWHDFTANIKYGITDALSLWHKYNVIAYTVVIQGRLDTKSWDHVSREDSASPAWLTALVIFRTLKSSFIFKYLREVFFLPCQEILIGLFIHLLFQIITSLWGRSALVITHFLLLHDTSATSGWAGNS